MIQRAIKSTVRYWRELLALGAGLVIFGGFAVTGTVFSIIGGPPAAYFFLAGAGLALPFLIGAGVGVCLRYFGVYAKCCPSYDSLPPSAGEIESLLTPSHFDAMLEQNQNQTSSSNPSSVTPRDLEVEQPSTKGWKESLKDPSAKDLLLFNKSALALPVPQNLLSPPPTTVRPAFSPQ